MAVRLARITAVGHRIQAVRALRQRNFRWLWFNTAASSAGLGMQFLILGWLALSLTDSSTQLGLVIFLYGIPNLCFVMFGGIIADRVDRRRLLINTQAVVTTLVFIIATLTIADLVKVWHIYITAFILGTLQAINMPARMAIVSDIVDREDIMNAVALNSAVMNIGRMMGPGVAGVIAELTDIGPALYFNAGCYFVGTICLFPIRGEFQQRAGRKTTVLGDLRVGVSYFWSTPVVLTIIGAGFALGFFGTTYLQVIPAFAKEELGAGVGEAGLLITAAGVGSLVGSIVLASLGDFRHKNWLLMGTFLTFCLALFLFAWSPWYWVSWVILLFVGLGSMTYVSMGTTVIQLTVPSEVQGRVLSLWTVGAALVYVGALPMAAVADKLGWTTAIAGGAIICLAVFLWLGVWRPTLRYLKV